MTLHHGALRLLLTGFKTTNLPNTVTAPCKHARPWEHRFASRAQCINMLHPSVLEAALSWVARWPATCRSPSKESCPVSADYSGWIPNRNDLRRLICRNTRRKNSKWSQLWDYSDAVQGNGKVKCTLVQALRLCTGRTAHRGSGGIALLFLDHGTRRGWGVIVTPRPLFTPGKDPVPIVQGQVRKISPPTGIRSPDRPARSQSLYRLRYPVHDALQGSRQVNTCLHSTTLRGVFVLLLSLGCQLVSD